MICEKCIHHDVCHLFEEDFVKSACANGFCGKFKDKSRIVELPCAPGTEIWTLSDVVWDDECAHCEHYRVGGFGDPSECARTRFSMKHPDCIKIESFNSTLKDILTGVSMKWFGKKWFTSKEDAEDALNKMKLETKGE